MVIYENTICLVRLVAGGTVATSSQLTGFNPELKLLFTCLARVYLQVYMRVYGPSWLYIAV